MFLSSVAIRRRTALFTLAVSGLLLAIPAVAHSENIGIIKGRSGCPSGAQEIVIAMDNEDGSEESSLSGWVGATTLDSNGNVTYRFCTVDSGSFSDAPGMFTVLKLSDSCPAGTFHYTRTFDNEHSHSQNSSSPVPINSNWVTRSPSQSVLSFCAYPGNGTGTFPNLGVEYGVLGNSNAVTTALEYGQVFNDDEDSWPGENGNIYEYNFHGLFAFDRSRYSPDSWSVDGAQNTTLYMARVTSTPPPTRPVASCSATPNSGIGSLTAAFSGSGSYARNGRELVSYSWTFSNGGSASGSGPHSRTFWGPPFESSTTYYGQLTVTDNAGETSSMSCYVHVYEACNFVGEGTSLVPEDCGS